MVRLPPGQKFAFFKENALKSGGFMGCIFGIGSMFR